MNYILRYTGSPMPDVEVVIGILKTFNVQILDPSGLPKMILIGDLTDQSMSQIKAMLPEGWNFYPHQDQKYSIPDTKRKIKKK